MRSGCRRSRELLSLLPPSSPMGPSSPNSTTCRVSTVKGTIFLPSPYLTSWFLRQRRQSQHDHQSLRLYKGCCNSRQHLHAIRRILTVMLLLAGTGCGSCGTISDCARFLRTSGARVQRNPIWKNYVSPSFGILLSLRYLWPVGRN